MDINSSVPGHLGGDVVVMGEERLRVVIAWVEVDFKVVWLRSGEVFALGMWKQSEQPR